MQYGVVLKDERRTRLLPRKRKSLSLLGHKTIQNQPMETVTIRRGKKPSQMRKAHDANSNSPAEALKPAKFPRGRTRMTASLNGSKTPYLKNNPVGVGKGVLMRPLDYYPLSRTRYDVMALTAKDIFLFIRLFLFGFILNKTVRHFIALFFMRQAEKAVRTRINCFSCYHPLPSGKSGKFDKLVKSQNLLNYSILRIDNVFK